MKINWMVRLKNPWFWSGLVSVMLTAMGVSPEMLTSWEALGQALKELVANPFMLGTTAMAVLGVLVDPTTKGVCDSQQALGYQAPKEG